LLWLLYLIGYPACYASLSLLLSLSIRQAGIINLDTQQHINQLEKEYDMSNKYNGLITDVMLLLQKDSSRAVSAAEISARFNCVKQTAYNILNRLEEDAIVMRVMVPGDSSTYFAVNQEANVITVKENGGIYLGYDANLKSMYPFAVTHMSEWSN